MVVTLSPASVASPRSSHVTPKRSQTARDDSKPWASSRLNDPRSKVEDDFIRYTVLMEKRGNSDPLEEGVSSTGFVYGLARMDPREKEPLPAPKPPPTRAKVLDGARFPEPRPWCAGCEGTGWVEREGLAYECDECVA
jgi:hypothetical protein